jgi:hypothetical protein
MLHDSAQSVYAPDAKAWVRHSYVSLNPDFSSSAGPPRLPRTSIGVRRCDNVANEAFLELMALIQPSFSPASRLSPPCLTSPGLRFEPGHQVG